MIQKVFFIICWLLAGTIGASASKPDFLSRVWEDKSTGILDLSLVSIDIDVSGQRILCASNTRIYLSENKGRNWQMVLKPRRTHDWDDIEDEASVKTDVEEEDLDIAVDRDFERSEYDEEELHDLEILDYEEELDSISDEELEERLEEAGIRDMFDTINDMDDDDDDGYEEDIESFFETDSITIRQVCWNPVFSQYAYTATNQGLYVSSNAGRRWIKVSVTDDGLTEDILAVTAVSPDGFVIATLSDGVFVSSYQGTSFTELSGVLPNQVFIDVEEDKYIDNSIVILSENHVFWGVIGELFQTETIEKSLFMSSPHLATVTNTGVIYLAGNNFLVSLTETGHWEEISISELLGDTIQDIDYSSDVIIIATNRGVFFWNVSSRSGRYHNIGLTDYDVHDIAVNFLKPEEVWIATASGAFLLTPPHTIDREFLDMKYMPEKLPALEDLIKTSLRYTEIDLFRDRVWFERMQRGAWLPQVDVTCRLAPRMQERMTRNTTFSLSRGKIYTGPISERYDHRDRELFRVHVGLSWKPKLLAFNHLELSIQQRIRSENIRKNRQMKNIRKLYILLAQLYRDRQLAENVREEVDNYIRIQQVQAQLNALTGYSYDQLFNKVFPK